MGYFVAHLSRAIWPVQFQNVNIRNFFPLAFLLCWIQGETQQQFRGTGDEVVGGLAGHAVQLMGHVASATALKSYIWDLVWVRASGRSRRSSKPWMWHAVERLGRSHFLPYKFTTQSKDLCGDIQELIILKKMCWTVSGEQHLWQSLLTWCDKSLSQVPRLFTRVPFLFQQFQRLI